MNALPHWLTPGAIIDGKYEIVRLLGAGGMGAVCEAQHKAIGGRVALKVLHGRAERDAESTARFLREARAAFSIASENVVRVLDAGTAQNGEPYIVMELLEGTDLATHLKSRGPLTAGEAVEYIAQAASALGAAHAQGIIHRDVKPANLFLTRRPDGAPLVKVLDFGIAKASEPFQAQLTESNTAIGTVPYMSPEQLKASRDVDARADVYSLGVVLFELLTGHAMFEAPSAAELIVKILHLEPVPLRALRPDLPEGLENVIARATRKNRDERYASTTAFATEARAALAGAPIPNVSTAPSALAQTVGAPMQLVAPPTYGPPATAPTMLADSQHGALYRGAAMPMPIVIHKTGPNKPLVVGGAVVGSGGILTSVAALTVVNYSETATVLACGLAALVAGGVLFALGLVSRR